MARLLLAALCFGVAVACSSFGADDNAGASAKEPAGDASVGNASVGDAAGGDADVSPNARPIKFVAASTVGPLTTASVIVNSPAGLEVDDVVVLALYCDLTETMLTAPPGWTEVTHVNLVSDSQAFWFVHVVRREEPGAHPFALSASVKAAAVAAGYRGVDPAAPIHTSASAPSAMQTVIATAPTITPAVPNTRLLVSFVSDAQALATWTAPSGMTLIDAIGNIAIYDEARPSPGRTETRTATSTETRGTAGCQIALTPAL